MVVTLKQLEAFIAAARTGSFSAAAQMVHISQPALTAMIQKLELQLGETLFTRKARGSHLTTAGRELLPDIERIVNDLDTTIANVLDQTAPRGGTVTIASIPSAAAAILPPLIAAFEREHPRIRIVVRDAMPENSTIVAMVHNGEVDFGFAHASAETQALRFRALTEDNLVAIVPAGSAAAGSQTLRWAELPDSRLIRMSSRSYIRQLVDETLARVGTSRRPYVEVSLVTTAVGMVRAGLGVAVLPGTAAAVCNTAGVDVLRLVEPEVRRPVGLLFRAPSVLSPAAKHFMRFATKSMVTTGASAA
jgi:LysR family carnitine catabolism transcriptional activator